LGGADFSLCVFAFCISEGETHRLTSALLIREIHAEPVFNKEALLLAREDVRFL
jgi:hypothetical protein